jgi:hypothetical protein
MGSFSMYGMERHISLHYHFPDASVAHPVSYPTRNIDFFNRE